MKSFHKIIEQPEGSKLYLGSFLILLFIIIFEKSNAQAPDYLWVKTLADSTNGDSSGWIYSSSINVDPISGAVYTAGGFGGTVDFDPGIGEYTLSTSGLGDGDMFISKLDSNGNFIWTISFTGVSNGGVNQILVEPNTGNIFVAGAFNGTVDMDPGPNTFNLISSGSSDIFVAKLNSSGNLIWAKSMGGIDSEGATSMTLDEDSNIYITGAFSGICDFDPGNGVYNLTSNGDEDIYICKLDSEGNFVWVRQVGGSSTDRAKDIAIDHPNGENIVITGEFNGMCDFDPGPGTFIINGFHQYDIFILKLNNAGSFLWAKSIGGSYQGEVKGITINQTDGSIYTTGYFSWTVDFDPGPGFFNITSLGIWDIFISKLDSDGNFVWATGIGGSYSESAYDITLDESGNIYTTGFFTYTCDFDPGSGIFNLTAVGNEDGFVLKLSPAGAFMWAKAFSGVKNEYGTSIATDLTGLQGVYTVGATLRITDFDPGPSNYYLGNSNDEHTQFTSKLDINGDFVWAKAVGFEEVAYGAAYTYSIVADPINGDTYTSGTFTGKIDFDPGIGVLDLVSTVYSDAFVTKLTADGQLVWVKTFGAPNGNIWLCPMTWDYDDGDIYVAGGFWGLVDFDPGPGTYEMHTGESADAFICKLDNNGNFQWVKSFKGSGNVAITSIFVDSSANIYTTGNFSLSIDFDPGGDEYTLFSNGGDDIFISKLDSLGNFLWAKSMGGILTWENDIFETGTSIVVDPVDGAVYTTGEFDWTPVDFDPGPGTFIIETGSSVNTFILKLDAGGNFSWAKSFSGESWTVGNSIDISSVSHHVLTTGYFSDRVDFDPGPGAFNLDPVGITDAFISALDSSGNFVFAKAVGGPGFDTGTSIVSNNWGSEHIYVTGAFEGTADFDPGSDTINIISEGSYDMFLLKCDGAGNYAWVKSAGGTLSESGVALARGDSDHVHLTGGLSSPSVWFDSINFTNSLPYTLNSFIAKIGQCSSVVTSAGDSGNGSLRDVISCVSNGGTITFSIPPMSQITLTSGEIVINKNLILSGPGIYDLTLSGNNTSRIFNLLPGKNFTIKNLSLKNASAVTNGGAIYVKGNLTLENVILQNNFQNGIPKGLTISPGALVTIIGTVDIKN